MKQVISISRRTDIPAFYLNWLIEHIRKGCIKVANPFNRSQVRHVSLSRENVAWLVFWSRNYEFFLQKKEIFSDYNLYFHFTINPSHALLEPGMIRPTVALRQMEMLCNHYDPRCIMWRYDPIVFYERNGELQTNHDIHIFKLFAREVSNMGIQNCTISIVQIYPKIVKRAKKISNFRFIYPAQNLLKNILQELTDTASDFGLTIYSCSNDSLLQIANLKKGHCINGALLNHLADEKVSERLLSTRPDCGCTESIDIGDYVRTRCHFKCLYCYARP